MRMLKHIAVMVALALPAQAADTNLEKLNTWGQGRGWEGVGLLVMDGQASCTGTMISPDLVLTAAHCLFDSDTGARVDPRKIEFRAGWRDGRSVARRMGRRAITHPQFADLGRLEISSDQIRVDVALVQLADPIQPTHADPFRTDRGVSGGDAVSVVSYGKGRNDAPSRQRQCEVLEAQGGVLALSCDAVPGSSGSPVFEVIGGRPRIVALISAIGHLGTADVSFGMDIEAPLAKVMSDFRAGRGVWPAEGTVAAKRLVVGSGKQISGARFVKP